MKTNLTPSNPDDFEKLIALLYQKSGFQVVMLPPNTKGYDIELRREHECIAVQAKCHKAKCSVAQIQDFLDYLELPVATKFTSGWFISPSGFSRPALTHVETERPSNGCLGSSADGDIFWNYPVGELPPEAAERQLKYIAVFTS